MCASALAVIELRAEFLAVCLNSCTAAQFVIRCIHSVRSKNAALAETALNNLIACEDFERGPVSVCEMLESIGLEAKHVGLDSVVAQAFKALFTRLQDPPKRVQLLQYLIQLTQPDEARQRESKTRVCR